MTASFGVVEVDQERVSATKTITVDNKGSRAAVYRVSYDALVQQPGVRYSLSAQRLTVPPGQSRTVTITMTATQDDLLKIADPTVVVDDGRQFLGEASGRVVLTPTNNRGETLRVPVHANPKPSSTLTATPAEDGSTIGLAGEAVANGDLFDATSYTSLVSAFEQLGTSPEMPKCTTELLSTCYKTDSSARSTWPASGWPRTPCSTTTPVVLRGLRAREVHVGGDGRELRRLHGHQRRRGLGLPAHHHPDRRLRRPAGRPDRPGLQPGRAGDEPYVAPMNLYDGLVDTNAYDSDVQVLGVPLSILPADTGRITFGVQSASYNGTVDDVGTVSTPAGPELAPQAMSFDPTAPGLSFSTEDGTALMVPATDGTQIAVTQDAASYAADTAVGGDKGAMVVLSQNSSAAGRTQSVPIAATGGADSTVVTVPPAEEAPPSRRPTRR